MAILDRVVQAASQIELDSVPTTTIEHAGHVIADTVAVSRGGTRQPEMAELLELEELAGSLVPWQGTEAYQAGGRRLSTVLSAPARRATPERAAFLNATAGSFLELDEGMRPTGHPGMQVVIPAIAAAEAAGCSGSTLLRAVLVGYETASRLFTGFRLRYPVHPHGHFGAIGGAVAAALIDGADPQEAARIAATTPILSIWDACYDGATARNTWMGLAAQTAVRATFLGRAGFTGSADAFEAAFGSIAGSLVDEEALVGPLDHERLGIQRNYFKIHSACALTHAALDAMFRLEPTALERIESILVETVSNNMKLDRQAAPNALSARFSLPYAVATVAVVGRSDPTAFFYREDVATLAEHVQVMVAPDLEAQWPDSSPARVTVVSAAGTHSAEVQNPHGFHSAPITAVELRQKFDSLIGDESTAESWWNRLTRLDRVADCSRLFAGGVGA